MEMNKLRIGNIVGSYSSKEPFLIVEILTPGTCHLSGQKYPDDARDIFDIPLSDEWLWKLGLTSLGKNKWTHKAFLFIVVESKSDKWCLQLSKTISLDIAFVHELQNLFLDITRTELSIKF